MESGYPNLSFHPELSQIEMVEFVFETKEEGTVPVKENVQTRMNLVEFEKSKFPLHLTSNNEYMNFIFQEEIGPNFWLTWFTFKGARGFSNWVLIIDFSPTRNLQQIWFKGELVFMLLGGFCSPSRKEKKQSAEEEAINRKKQSTERTFNFSVFVLCDP